MPAAALFPIRVIPFVRPVLMVVVPVPRPKMRIPPVVLASCLLVGVKEPGHLDLAHWAGPALTFHLGLLGTMELSRVNQPFEERLFLHVEFFVSDVTSAVALLKLRHLTMNCVF